jgi:pimeloyl-ACP methyl ester carboxylesterase
MRGWIVAAGMALAACTPAPAPQAAGPQLGFAAGPCAADLKVEGRTVECGEFRVLENRAAPEGRKVSTPVVIVRAATEQKATPVIFLHGGPGGGVVEGLSRRFAAPGFSEVFTPDRDWVFFDQRGSGLSQPLLDCGAISLTDAGIATDADVAAAAACAKSFVEQGIDLSQYNSEVIASDIAELKTALGYKELDLFGVSYGVRVAMAVAQYRPEGIRAMVLDSPYPPEAKGTQELPRITAGLTRQLLAKQKGKADRFAAMLTQWEKAPPEGVTTDDVGQYLVDTLYSADGVANFGARIDALLKGDLAGLKAYIGERSGYVEIQNLTHFCKEELPFEDRAKMIESAKADPIARAVAGPAGRYFDACAGVPVGAPNPKEIEPVITAIPTLFLVAGIDPGCPEEFVAPAAAKMSAAQMVVFPARTHGVSRLSACGRGMIAGFLADPAKPVDRSCLKQEPKAP